MRRVPVGWAARDEGQQAACVAAGTAVGTAAVCGCGAHSVRCALGHGLLPGGLHDMAHYKQRLLLLLALHVHVQLILVLRDALR